MQVCNQFFKNVYLAFDESRDNYVYLSKLITLYILNG